MLNINNLFLIILLIFSAEAAAIDIVGDYHNRFNCVKAGKESGCKLYLLEQDLVITKASRKRLKILVEAKFYLGKKDEAESEPYYEPYYCSIEGYAVYKNNNTLVVYKDTAGNEIDNFQIFIRDNDLTIDAKMSKSLKWYCGDHISIENMRFSRLHKTTIGKIKNLEPIY